jgi:hypothetical protein
MAGMGLDHFFPTVRSSQSSTPLRILRLTAHSRGASHSEFKPVDRRTTIEDTIQGLAIRRR